MSRRGNGLVDEVHESTEGHSGLQVVPEVGVAGDSVAVAPTDLLFVQVAVLDEVRDDSLRLDNAVNVK